jgi:hypothetical protein
VGLLLGGDTLNDGTLIIGPDDVPDLERPGAAKAVWRLLQRLEELEEPDIVVPFVSPLRPWRWDSTVIPGRTIDRAAPCWRCRCYVFKAVDGERRCGSCGNPPKAIRRQAGLTWRS